MLEGKGRGRTSGDLDAIVVRLSSAELYLLRIENAAQCHCYCNLQAKVVQLLQISSKSIKVVRSMASLHISLFDVYTNNMEVAWRRLTRSILSRGDYNAVKRYLAENVYRHRYFHNMDIELLPNR